MYLQPFIMKNRSLIAIISFLILSNTLSFSQSLSTSKIFGFLETQSLRNISKSLQEKGFKYINTTSVDNGITLEQYSKNGSYGNEKISIGKNDELFILIYHPATIDLYKGMKEKALTSDFSLAYNYKQTKYFENGLMRIGINDISGDLSFFSKLK